MISYIIVTFNSERFIKKCIDSIISNNFSHEYEIIVVDNYSSDNTVLILEDNYKSIVRIVKSKVNLGFGKANNIGFGKSKGEYVFFINADAYFKCLNLDASFEILDKSDIVALSPKVFYPNGEIQPTGQSFPSIITYLMADLKIGKIYRTYHKYIPLDKIAFLPKSIKSYLENYDSNNLKCYDWISAAAFIIKRNEFQNINGFDDNIFLYNEDVDLCKRLSYRNKKVGVSNFGHVVHYVGESSRNNKFVEEIKMKSKLYYAKKHFNKIHYSLVFAYFTIKQKINKR